MRKCLGSLHKKKEILNRSALKVLDFIKRDSRHISISCTIVDLQTRS